MNIHQALLMSYGGGNNNDPFFNNIASLLHFDGTNGSTTITDVKGKTWSAASGAQISTAVSKFGGASLSLNGTSAYVWTNAHADFQMGAGDFTFEGFAYFTSSSSFRTFISNRSNFGNNESFCFYYNAGNLIFEYSSNGTSVTTYTVAWTPSLNTQYFIQAVRSGANLTIAVDGAAIGTVHNIGTTSLFASAQAITLGRLNSTSTGGEFSGYLDEWRITKGVARPIAVPTAAFPNS
ncbi:LamG-like jellyroll fold domain-containing protein [Pseudomonas nitroreducens]|uniref:LamG-like jellyroll fold domain-containing protein n=1 Tax=Pseudomonas nitroreducens TaxID=46680 RepID=UPI00351D74E0